jgi:pyruvate formate lyase activating enzyme
MSEEKISIATAEEINLQNCNLKIHSVESMGTYDGPGIRFIIFLQGCPMRCLYCANPDTMRYDEGEYQAIESLFDQALRMKPYFSSGGGVTASGGEPCCQAKNLIPLFKKLKSQGIHTALDTNGYVMNDNVKELLKWTDLVLLDIKQMDSSMHEVITGRDNKRVLNFASYLKSIGKPSWLRYVLVPGLTDKQEDLELLGEHFKSYENIEKIEIQPYHTLGKHKWQLLDKKYPLEDVPLNSEENIQRVKGTFEQYFKEVVVN